MHLASSFRHLSILFTTLAITSTGCLPFGAETASTTAEPSTDGGLKIEDVYGATMALVATSQLSGIVASETNIGQDDANIVAGRLRAGLAKQACATVGGEGATISVDFGAGCTLPGSSLEVVGKATMTVTVQGTGADASLRVDMTVDGFGAGGKTATGAASITAKAAADGQDVDIATTMTAGDAALLGGVHVDVMSTPGAAPTKVVFSTLPDTTVSSGKSTLAVDASAVTFAAGECYPSGGTVVLSAAGVKATLAFTASTAQTGIAQFTPPLSKKADDKELPGLGWKCR